MAKKNFIQIYFTENPLWWIYAILTLFAIIGSIIGISIILKNAKSIHFKYEEETIETFTR